MASASSSTRNRGRRCEDGVQREELELLKKQRSGLIGNLTRLEGELDVLLLDVSYREAMGKKQEYDEAHAKCTEHCVKFLNMIPHTENYDTIRKEAEEACMGVKTRKSVCDEKFELYVQRHTDSATSASQAYTTNSHRSSVSSLTRKLEIMELRRVQAEMQAQLTVERERSKMKAEMEEQRRQIEAEAAKRQIEAEAAKRQMEEQRRQMEAEAAKRQMEEQRRQMEAEVEKRQMKAEIEEQRRQMEAEAERRQMKAQMEEQR